MNVGRPNSFAQGVEGWTGSTLSGSERVKATEKEAAAAAKAAGTTKKVEDDKVVPDPPKKKYSFDPFDEKSWWKPTATKGTPAKGSLVDAKL